MVNVMYILTVNIFQIMTDMANNTITNKFELAYGLLICILTFDLDQGQGQAHFDCEYL